MLICLLLLTSCLFVLIGKIIRSKFKSDYSYFDQFLPGWHAIIFKRQFFNYNVSRFISIANIVFFIAFVPFLLKISQRLVISGQACQINEKDSSNYHLIANQLFFKNKNYLYTQNKLVTSNKFKIPNEIIKNSGLNNKINYNADCFD